VNRASIHECGQCRNCRAEVALACEPVNDCMKAKAPYAHNRAKRGGNARSPRAIQCGVTTMRKQ
jgi:hypothetical protein